jgi:hypothetical protein
MTYQYDANTSALYSLDDEGRPHSINDEPSIVHINHNTKVWMKNGKLDRNYNNGPALTSNIGKNYKEIYFKDGEIHNPIGIASKYGQEIKYFYEGVQYKKFSLNCNGEIHGYQYAKDGNNWIKEIWVDGKKIDFNGYPVIVNRRKYNDKIIFGYDYEIDKDVYDINQTYNDEKYKRQCITMFIDEDSMIYIHKKNNNYLLGNLIVNYDELMNIIDTKLNDEIIIGNEYIST